MKEVCIPRKEILTPVMHKPETTHRLAHRMARRTRKDYSPSFDEHGPSFSPAEEQNAHELGNILSDTELDRSGVVLVNFMQLPRKCFL